MWILDSEADVLRGALNVVLMLTLLGNRYWLRPGQEYTLGRNPRRLQFMIFLIVESRIELSAFKTVSKTHITIIVGNVAGGSAVLYFLCSI